MKVDGFGITHNPSCRHPHWATRISGDRTIQYCRRCEATWKHGQPSEKPQPQTGWK